MHLNEHIIINLGIKHKQFVTLRDEKTDAFETRPIVFANAEKLLHRVCQERKFEINNVLVKIYADLVEVLPNNCALLKRIVEALECL